MKQTLNGTPYNSPGPMYAERVDPVSKDKKISEVFESGYRSQINSSTGGATSKLTAVKGVTYSFEGKIVIFKTIMLFLICFKKIIICISAKTMVLYIPIQYYNAALKKTHFIILNYVSLKKI